MQGWLNIWKLINVICHINRIKGKKPRRSSQLMQKSIWQNSATIPDNNTQQTRNRRKLPQHNKTYIYKNFTANIILNGKRLKAFPLRTRKEDRFLRGMWCPLPKRFSNSYMKINGMCENSKCLSSFGSELPYVRLKLCTSIKLPSWHLCTPKFKYHRPNHL